MIVRSETRVPRLARGVVGYSLFQVPYIALPAELTADYDERTRLISVRVAVLDALREVRRFRVLVTVFVIQALAFSLLPTALVTGSPWVLRGYRDTTVKGRD